MKLDCILTACTTNPFYMDFIPIFIRAWKKLYPGVDVKIILIAHYIPSELEVYSQNIILFPPIADIHDAYISQIIRILYPSLLSYTDAVLITDIDMLPMNSTYYSKPLELLSNDKFVHYRNGPMYWQNAHQYAICYNAAAPHIWKEINGVHTIDDLVMFIKTNYNASYNGNVDQPAWYSDQILFYKMIQNWNNKDSQLIHLNDKETGFCRLDRSEQINMDLILPNIQRGYYTDYHCLRPYKEFQTINDKIVDNLPSTMHSMNRTLSDSNYGTHMAPLVAAVMNTRGPILELGCGDYSTPILHEICKAQNRYLLTCDTSKQWMTLFKDLESPLHNFTYVPVYEDDWALNPKPEVWDTIGHDHTWGVVFIDHRPGERRKHDIVRFANQAEIIVVHDSEEPGYQYESVFHTFKYRYDYKRYSVYTTLVSNVIDVSKLFSI